MTETLVTTDGKVWYWYLISEHNNHVIAQGVTKREATAVRHVQQALFSYLELAGEN